MIRRHPHVFADGAARDPQSVKAARDRIKAEERADKAAERAQISASPNAVRARELGRPEPASSTLADIPIGLPGLTRAIKLQDKAAKVGFDWPNLAPVFDKLKEEIAEFEEVAFPADPRAPSGRLREAESEGAIKEEFGDMLFVMANIARHLHLDPEAALRAANQKFVRRFAHIETRLAEHSRTPSQSTLEEMDALWDEAKAIEKSATSKKA